MISKCTVIIPTFNRPKYLRRILSYYNGFEDNYNVIVADSSSDENKKINKKNISPFSNLNVQYLDNYSSKINPYYKIADASSHVNTKYSVLCADDDFTTPNGINKSVDFLEKNPDFSCAHGHYISFYLKTNKKRKQKICWTPIYPYNSIFFSDAKSRLNYNFCSYYPNFYAVHKTDFLKMIFKETIKYTDDGRFGELLPSMLDLIYGKMKKLDVLYGAREVIDNSGGSKYKRLMDFMKDGTYEKKYNKFRECLVKHLIKNSQMISDEAKELIDKAMSAYLKKYYSKSFKGILIGKMSNLLDALDLPESINKNIRMLYRKIFIPRYVLNRSKEIDNFKNTIESQDSKYFDDFERIRKHVLLYAKNNNKNIKDTI